MANLLERLRGALTTPGGRKPADPLVSIAAQLDRLGDALAQAEMERADAERRLALCGAARDQLLFDGATREQIAAHDAQADEDADTVRALQLFAKAQLRRRDQLIAQRTELLSGIFSASWHKSASALSETLLRAHTEHAALTQIVALALESGLQNAASAMFPPPPWPFRDGELFAVWAQAVAERAPGYRPPPPVQPIAPPIARPVARPAPNRTAPAHLPPPAGGPRPPRALPTAEPGTVPVRVLRPGYQPDTFQFLPGEIAHVPADVAEIAARNGAVEFAPPDAAAAP